MTSKHAAAYKAKADGTGSHSNIASFLAPGFPHRDHPFILFVPLVNLSLLSLLNTMERPAPYPPIRAEVILLGHIIPPARIMLCPKLDKADW
jgi:hypothetical protein